MTATGARQKRQRWIRFIPGKHTEAAFEAAVLADLVAQRGWAEGSPDDFDRQLALVPKDLFAFVEATQPDLWA